MCDLLQIPSKSFLAKPIYQHVMDGEREGAGEVAGAGEGPMTEGPGC
jgi:hypothetical protein